jgi:DNA-binding response OmpR family regulator
MDGMEVCRRLRAAGDWTPVLFVTARDDEVDRIVGLELGADDYVTKPFSPREVVSRVKAVLRRAEVTQAPGQVLVAGAVTLDPGRRTVVAGGQEIALTATEFDLLAHLMRHRRQVLRREQLLAEVWGYPDDVTTRTVDVHIAALRAKLGDASPVRTVRGVGYAVD